MAKLPSLLSKPERQYTNLELIEVFARYHRLFGEWPKRGHGENESNWSEETRQNCVNRRLELPNSRLFVTRFGGEVNTRDLAATLNALETQVRAAEKSLREFKAGLDLR